MGGASSDSRLQSCEGGKKKNNLENRENTLGIYVNESWWGVGKKNAGRILEPTRSPCLLSLSSWGSGLSYPQRRIHVSTS